jgi:hypothetical protein
MGGAKHSSDKLNNSLEITSKILNDNNIKNWFIAYGTLLGIVRENSCINNDDDIDIITDINNHDIIKQLFIDNNMRVSYDKNTFFRIDAGKTHGPIDFYFAELDNSGNFYDAWEKIVWSNCYNPDNNLIEYMWNDNKLYLPFNYEEKLINQYGEDWKIPADTKGPTPQKKCL